MQLRPLPDCYIHNKQKTQLMMQTQLTVTMCSTNTSKFIHTKYAAVYVCAAVPLWHGQQALNIGMYLGFSIRATKPAVSER
jgi:hypothetical protein